MHLEKQEKSILALKGGRWNKRDLINCNLCLWEKYFLICKPEMATFNTRTELTSNCRPSKNFLLKSAIAELSFKQSKTILVGSSLPRQVMAIRGSAIVSLVNKKKGRWTFSLCFEFSRNFFQVLVFFYYLWTSLAVWKMPSCWKTDC